MVKEDDVKKWIRVLPCSGEPKINLFCFHHVGGAPSTFLSWREGLPDDINLCLYHLPGRGRRINEPNLKSTKEILDSFTPLIDEFSNLPNVFFGHSMGAYLCYEIACHLANLKKPLPRHLILSGMEYGNRVSELDQNHSFTNEEDRDLLRGLQKKLDWVLSDYEEGSNEYKKFSDMVRADYTISNQPYIYKNVVLPIPITGICARDDQLITVEGMMKWKERTSERFECRVIGGKHLSIIEDPSEYLLIICEILNKLKNNK